MNLRQFLVVLTVTNLCSLSLFSTGFSAEPQQPYCIALRGNGELMPSHWGAMAKVIETFGEPSKGAGGSSASITLFLLESFKMNPMLSKDPELRKKNLSLLFKTIPEYFNFLTRSSIEGKLINDWLKDSEFEARLSIFMDDLEKDPADDENSGVFGFAQRSYDLFLALFNETNNRIAPGKVMSLLPYINPEYLDFIKGTLKLSAKSQITLSDEKKASLLKQIRGRYQEATRSIKLLGAFDAKDDTSIFFRPGVVSFEKLAWRFGHLADAYAGINSSQTTKSLIQDFFEQCRDVAVGKSWKQIQEQASMCVEKYNQWMDSAFADLNGGPVETKMWARTPFRLNQKVGATMDIFPITSVVSGQSINDYQRQAALYLESFDPETAKNFRVPTENLSIGYWGKPETLKLIRQNLQMNFSKDYKSSLFKSLGSVSWNEVLLSSPAEPGLSTPVLLSESSLNANERLLSFGGWPDLHPVLILKAAGCDNVVYITRKGGDSMFGQGVNKRLTGLDGFKFEEFNVGLNNAGKPDDLTSTWSRWYNLANPESSFRTALRESSAIYCTDWNRFKIKDGPNKMADHGYSEGILRLNNQETEYPLKTEFPGCF